MLAKKSVLILNESVITKSICEMCQDDEMTNSVEFKKIHDQYTIDIDFNIYIPEDFSGAVIGTEININKEKKGGYFISVESMSSFSFDENQELSETEKKQLIQFSGVSMCITNLRAYISNMTSYFIFGKYNFASIDMNDLIQQKIDLERGSTL